VAGEVRSAHRKPPVLQAAQTKTLMAWSGHACPVRKTDKHLKVLDEPYILVQDKRPVTALTPGGM
jgi:hypothetical protein